MRQLCQRQGHESFLDRRGQDSQESLEGEQRVQKVDILIFSSKSGCMREDGYPCRQHRTQNRFKCCIGQPIHALGYYPVAKPSSRTNSLSRLLGYNSGSLAAHPPAEFTSSNSIDSTLEMIPVLEAVLTLKHNWCSLSKPLSVRTITAEAWHSNRRQRKATA